MIHLCNFHVKILKDIASEPSSPFQYIVSESHWGSPRKRTIKFLQATGSNTWSRSHSKKKCCLMFRQKFMCFGLYPLLAVLSLGITKNRLGFLLSALYLQLTIYIKKIPYCERSLGLSLNSLCYFYCNRYSCPFAGPFPVCPYPSSIWETSTEHSNPDVYPPQCWEERRISGNISS